ncbi:ribonuclease HII [Patescibacteria group bacterium]|nr:ribonuclease HII [Patescibacteria group bacterium]MBU1124037.1 ribonuclease HII [Patescibacteria group bacterium]MBU1911248.1 ribonuclease HII [Patescibacteria group bacterium]
MEEDRSSSIVIAGVDEAGRGALAGPVVAGACIIKSKYLPSFICDSKQLSSDERDKAFEWIKEYCLYGFGIVTAQEVDTLRILDATEKAMQRAVMQLSKIMKPTYLLIDGRDKFWFDYPHSSIIDGDILEPCISAASIVAKVTRDRIMKKHDRIFPHYDFKCHKGYGTPEHFDLIKSRGVCGIHRKSFLHIE